mmetsp:Transcript_24178/g.50231  ORF Transcript_24178/g.50231 Transcript_24178/m.50231 type:complete len:214 (+) Transcript_24178:117-758(+)
MATMVLESFMPLRCCMAPDIPTATYRSGATTFPVCPTWSSLGTYPASTAARDAPTAPFILSASDSSILKLSPFFMPRPPETTTAAEERSGRSEFDSDADTNAGEEGDSVKERASTGADPPVSAALSKAVGLTVTSLTSSLFLTLARALPAYMGRTKVSELCTSMTSVTGEAERVAAARGMEFLPRLEWGARMCVKGVEECAARMASATFSPPM